MSGKITQPTLTVTWLIGARAIKKMKTGFWPINVAIRFKEQRDPYQQAYRYESFEPEHAPFKSIRLKGTEKVRLNTDAYS